MRAMNLFRGVPGTVALTALFLTACPSEEPPGNTLTCGPNTKEVGGKCVSTVDEAPCGEGASRDPDTGQCEPDVECGTGTTYNPVTQTCEPDSECGPGTTLNEETGECEPDVVCGDDTTFDPATGACLPNAVCGEGTHFDEASGECVPDENCGEGTHFDPETGTCQPDLVCGPGLADVNGVCLSALDLIIEEADVEEPSPDDNDPALGGTPEAFALEPVGERAVLAGRIDRPVDRDGDGVIDQDIDVWRFTGVEGQLLNIRVITTGAFQPAFTLTGPNGYYREPQPGFSLDSSRSVVLPYDGEYDLTVLPNVVLQGSSGPIGGEDAVYAVIVEELDWPAPTLLSVPSDGSAIEGEGNILQVNSNFFKLSSSARGLTIAGESPTGNTRSVVYAFRTDRSLIDEFQVSSSGGIDSFEALMPMPSAGEVVLVYDWTTSGGFNAPYVFDANGIVDTIDLGTLGPDDSVEHRRVQFPAKTAAVLEMELPAGQVVLTDFRLSNTSSMPSNLVLVSPSGEVLWTRSGTSPDAWFYTVEAGTYVWLAQNQATSDNHPSIAVITKTPEDFGTFDGSVAELQKSSNGALLASGTRIGGEFFLVENTAPFALLAEYSYASGRPWLEIVRLSAGGATLGRTGTQWDRAPFTGVVHSDPGLTMLRLHPGTSGSSRAPDVTGWSLDVRLAAVPADEVEPNDELESAQTVNELPFRVVGTVSSGDVDRYALPISAQPGAGEALEVDIFRLSTTGTLKLTVTDQAETTALTTHTLPAAWSSGRIWIYPDIGTGPYAVTVECTSCGDGVEYILDVRAIDAFTESEPNNTAADGNDFGTIRIADLPVQFIGRHISGLPANDHYRFTLDEALPPGTALRFHYERNAASNTATMRFWDSALAQHFQVTNISSTVLLHKENPPPVQGDEEPTGPTFRFDVAASTGQMYRVTVDIVSEVEDSVPMLEGEGGAQTLATLAPGASTSITGGLRYQQTDVYEILLDSPAAEGEALIARFFNRNSLVRMDVSIRDAASNILASNNRTWGEAAAALSGPGPFYVHVSDRGASSTSDPQIYFLEVERTSGFTIEEEPNNTLDDANALTLPATVRGLADEAPAIDLFSITLAEDLAAGERLIVDGVALYTTADLNLRVLNEDDEEIAATSDLYPYLEVELPDGSAGTTYYLEVTGATGLLSNIEDAYVLEIDIAVP